ncbi:MAG TPA: bifunctional glutamate N-acetyltransferase/amino-acid acetyltransferase ArgJ [bacterium]|nr:bifunctional glutamate N-acetyltransferase/amino-acid acetyltransferase ArgJ [bacterium]
MRNNKRGGITYADGFLSSGIYSGIKKEGKDLSLIYSKLPCVAVGTFTTNKFKSYSLIVTMKNIKNPIHSIIVNSGNANACNGKENYIKTKEVVGKLAEKLKVKEENILFGSTGIIGAPLPYQKIISSLDELINSLSCSGHTAAAEGIITTDTFLKEFQINTGIKGRKKEIFIGGMAKGAGMINPDMATMLSFITTDAVIERDALETALKQAVDKSFNMLVVDNDTSTNDMVICLANGAARNKRIHYNTDEYFKFYQSLENVCINLAKMIAKDGEGATKFIEVKVKGGWCEKDVKKVAKKVCGSNLVKTAIYGCQPNWGRIIASVGSCKVKFNPEKLELKICGINIFQNGNVINFDNNLLRQKLQDKEILIEIDLKQGKYQTSSFGCDMTEKYIKINKEYE